MSSDKRTLHFYFDFISPFAYFAWRQIPDICDEYGVSLQAHPVVFGKLLDHWGQLGPAEIPPKRQWLFRYCLRYAASQGFNYDPPRFHPFNPLPALRMALPEVSGEQQRAVISAIFEAGWSRGADLGEPNSLLEILRHADIPCEEFLNRIEDPAVKDRLKAETAAAIDQGVFGVPSIIVDGDLHWGNDQLEYIRLILQGKDPIDITQLETMQPRERAIDRRAYVKKVESANSETG